MFGTHISAAKIGELFHINIILLDKNAGNRADLYKSIIFF